MTRSHSLGILALTSKGCALARRVKDLVVDRPVTLYLPDQETETDATDPLSFREKVQKAFASHDGLLFIMATGIVVRTVAPLLESKDRDPALLVMDEEGGHVISLVSGHLGGANALAVKLGALMGAQPVITTASDVSGTHAVDLLAQKYKLVLKDLKAAKTITALFVNGEDVQIQDPLGYLDREAFPLCKSPKGALVVSHEKDLDLEFPYVQLIPKDLVLGVGCRKDTPFDKVRKAIEKVLEEHNLSREAISALATVDLKAKEPALLEAADWLNIPMVVLERSSLKETEELFAQSEFVAKTLGTGAVAEPCGYLASDKGTLLVPKTIKDGVTLSLWRRKTHE